VLIEKGKERLFKSDDIVDNLVKET
jgi:hypothetical protein